jgi:hypothetical protein
VAAAGAVAVAVAVAVADDTTPLTASPSPVTAPGAAADADVAPTAGVAGVAAVAAELVSCGAGAAGVLDAAGAAGAADAAWPLTAELACDTTEVTGSVAVVTPETADPATGGRGSPSSVAACACFERSSMRKKMPAARIATRAAMMATRRGTDCDIDSSHSRETEQPRMRLPAGRTLNIPGPSVRAR